MIQSVSFGQKRNPQHLNRSTFVDVGWALAKPYHLITIFAGSWTSRERRGTPWLFLAGDVAGVPSLRTSFSGVRTRSGFLWSSSGSEFRHTTIDEGRSIYDNRISGDTFTTCLNRCKPTGHNWPTDSCCLPKHRVFPAFETSF